MDKYKSNNKMKQKFKIITETEFNILDYPEWCLANKRYLEEHKNKCCFCGDRNLKFQQGDGRYLHSLCSDCHMKYKDNKLKISIHNRKNNNFIKKRIEGK